MNITIYLNKQLHKRTAHINLSTRAYDAENDNNWKKQNKKNNIFTQTHS